VISLKLDLVLAQIMDSTPWSGLKNNSMEFKMNKMFTVLALIVLSGQVKASNCGSLSIDDLFNATLNGTVAKAIECPKKEIEPEKQIVGPAECRRMTLAALTNLKLRQYQAESLKILREVSQNNNCTVAVQENARKAIQVQGEEALRAAVLGK
jgi:hypothetical protein